MRRLRTTVLISLLAVGTGCLKSPDDNNTTDMSTTPDTGSDTGSDMGGGGDDASTVDMNQPSDVGVDMTIPCGPDGCVDGVCDATSNECVECLVSTDCDDAMLCDSDVNTCVECLGPMDCATNACSDTGDCVECTDESTCLEAGASVCNTTTNVCESCASEDDMQCEHLAATPLCRNDGCVACDANDDSVCAGTSCNLMTNTCTQTQKGSVGFCEVCVTDADCGGDSYCVVMDYQGAPRNSGDSGHCLPVFAVSCDRGTQRTSTDRTSIDGATGLSLCTVDEMRTTCEAFNTFGTQCTVAADCGATGAVCGLIQGQPPMACSYSCNADADCPVDVNCFPGAGAEGHCGFD